MYSDRMRYTGMSGVDTVSLVDQLMKAESMKYNRLFKKTEMQKFTQQAYRDVGGKFSDFKKNHFQFSTSGSNVNFMRSSTFNPIKADVTDASGATNDAFSVVKSPSDSTSYEIEVSQVATASKTLAKGDGQFKKTAEVAADTANIATSGSLAVNVNGIKKEIDLSGFAGGTTDDLVTFLNDELSANFAGNKVSFSNEGGKIAFNHVDGTNATISNTTDSTVMESLGYSETSVSTAVDPSKMTVEQYFGLSSNETFNVDGNAISFDAGETLGSFMDRINTSDLGIKASFSNLEGGMTLERTEKGEYGEINISNSQYDSSVSGTQTNGQSTIVTVNGTELISSTNEVEFDGVKINVSKTTSGPVTLEAGRDLDKAKENIIDMVEKYNVLLGEMYEQMRQKPSKSYEPLTKEERSALSDKEQENWDNKIKEGRLYNDEILNEMDRDLREAMREGVTLSDGSKLSLYDLGIETADYSSKGILKIDEEKLEAALSTHGDKVSELFTKSGDSFSTQGVSVRLDNVLNDYVGASGKITEKAGLESSALSMDNNSIQEVIDKSVKDMEKMFKELARKENHYYAMFSKMETAIMESNSQMDYMMSQMM